MTGRLWCDTYMWTEIDLDSYVRNYYVNIQVRAVSRWCVSIQTSFEIFKYLIKKKTLFIDDREIICDILIWTEIDLDSYVRNYYVNRQVRAVFRWCVSIQTIFEIFKYLIKTKKNYVLFMDDRKIRCDTYMWTEIDLDSYVRNYYVNRQVRAVSRWHVSIQTSFEIFKYLIKKKNPVYWWQGHYMWYPHLNRNWFGIICKELLCQ